MAPVEITTLMIIDRRHQALNEFKRIVSQLLIIVFEVNSNTTHDCMQWRLYGVILVYALLCSLVVQQAWRCRVLSIWPGVSDYPQLNQEQECCFWTHLVTQGLEVGFTSDFKHMVANFQRRLIVGRYRRLWNFHPMPASIHAARRHSFNQPNTKAQSHHQQGRCAGIHIWVWVIKLDQLGLLSC